MASIDWNKAKLYYLNNDTTLTKVAQKFHVSERSVFRRASKENWKELKAKHVSRVAERCQEKVAEKQAETFAEYAVELRQDIIDINRMLMQKVRETMAYSDAFSPRDLKSLSSMLQDLMINEEKMTTDQVGASKDQITIEFVNNDWDGDGNGNMETN